MKTSSVATQLRADFEAPLRKSHASNEPQAVPNSRGLANVAPAQTPDASRLASSSPLSNKSYRSALWTTI